MRTALDLSVKPLMHSGAIAPAVRIETLEPLSRLLRRSAWGRVPARATTTPRRSRSGDSARNYSPTSHTGRATVVDLSEQNETKHWVCASLSSSPSVQSVPFRNCLSRRNYRVHFLPRGPRHLPAGGLDHQLARGNPTRWANVWSRPRRIF